MSFFTHLLNSILVPTIAPLVAVILAGYVLGRLLPKLDDRTLSAMMLYVFTPALVLYGILTTNHEAGKELAQIGFFWFFHTALMLFASHQLMKLLGYSVHQRRLIVLTIMILNAANYPIPLNEFQYGEVGRETAIRVMLVVQIIFVTIGVYLASDKPTWFESLEEIFRLPLFYAAAVGFLFFFMGFRLPNLYHLSGTDAITAMASSTVQEGGATPAPNIWVAFFAKLIFFLQAPAVPLNLIMLGMIIGKNVYFIDVESYRRMLPAIGVSTVMRLVFSPILGIILIQVMKIQGQLAKTLLLHTAMPTAVYVAIFVSFYGQPTDKRFASMAIVISTLVSLITVPLLLAWIESSSLACFQMPQQ